MASRKFSYGVRLLSCGMWDLAPSTGIKSEPPALGAWSLSHWTTREVLRINSKIFVHRLKYTETRMSVVTLFILAEVQKLP